MRKYDYTDLKVDSRTYVDHNAIMASHCYGCKMIFTVLAYTPLNAEVRTRRKYREHLSHGIHDERIKARASLRAHLELVE